MSSHDMIPDPQDMFEHLKSTLDEVPDRLGTVNSDLRTPLEQIQFTLQNFVRNSDDPDNWELDISPNWRFEIEDSRDFEKSEGQAVIGGHIVVEDGEYKQYSFNLSILQRDNQPGSGMLEKEVNGALCCPVDHSEKWTMVRRFHFDIDSGGGPHESKPVCHLQTGGNISDGHGISKDFHYCRTELDKPRIQYPPMDLVLVLDMLLDQYVNLANNRDKHWKSLVFKSEKVLWAPYYSKFGSRYLGSSDPPKPAREMIKNH